MNISRVLENETLSNTKLEFLEGIFIMGFYTIEFIERASFIALEEKGIYVVEFCFFIQKI